ncbi:hypothetical protein [Legionella jamestowniensis]|uniref:Uncharacterized protein n=1 Tax=Legionella jamestowniensis TaxID=455 RepID=A0A0W0UW85_9GAMM|nr:hypothetical protein [Legionella jamestowniensis]KTD12126.1 hypothetical protein Ljam_0342 [Legionella jamestowniensis]SFL72690.1 hypothetical protein SAMN02746073_1665 [Legionella jamestowniensis DSM 19215]
MYHFCRTILLVIVWLSLLVAPYAFFSYLCYAGLCGGIVAEEVRRNSFYIKVWSYYIWLYPLIVFATLYLSRHRRLAEDSAGSLVMLLIPLISLLPLLYVHFQVKKISTHYAKQRDAYYTAQPRDFVCAPGKFIRQDNTHFYYFAGASGAWTVTYFDNYAEMVTFLGNNEIDISQCKNQKGISFYSLYP